MKKGSSSDISKIAVRLKKSKTDISIEERLVGCGKKENDHVIYVGEVVERAIKGEIGAIIKALTAGRLSRELYENRNGKMSADRVLGRLEMCDLLWNDLEQFVLDKDKLLTPINLDEAEAVAYNYTATV